MIKEFLFGLSFFGFATTACAGADSDAVQLDYHDAACERLDVQVFATAPSKWLSDTRLAYIESYVDNACQTGVPNVSASGRLVDLYYLGEILELIPSGLIAKSQGSPEYRADVVKAKIRRQLKGKGQARKWVGTFTKRDAAVINFMSCQLLSYTYLKNCEASSFDAMLAHAEGLSQFSRDSTVSRFLFAESKRDEYIKKVEKASKL